MKWGQKRQSWRHVAAGVVVCAAAFCAFDPLGESSLSSWSTVGCHGASATVGGDVTEGTASLASVAAELIGMVPRLYTVEQKAKAKASEKAAREGGALSLTDATYSEFMEAHPLVMVFYYAPWCYWSRAALPEYDAAAKLLAHHSPPVVLVKVDCTENEQVANKEDIREFPTMRLFIEGQPHPYEGRRYRTHIVHWVDSKVDRDKALTTQAHLDELVGSAARGHVAVVAALPKDAPKGAFESVARAFGEEVFFGDVSDPVLVQRLVDVYVKPKLEGKEAQAALSAPFLAIFSHHKTEPQVHLLRGPLTEAGALRSFVRQWLYPVVSLFDAETIATSFFHDPRPKLVLIVDSKTDKQALNGAAEGKGPLFSAFRNVAERHRASFVATVCGNGHAFERQLLSVLGVDDEPLPLVRIMSVNTESDGRHHPAHKFKPPSPLQLQGADARALEAALEGFVTAFAERRVSPYFRSEPAPESAEPAGQVRTVVGSTFAAELSSAPNVFMEFYAPWCGFCRKLEGAYRQLAKWLRGVEGVRVARIDATRNEVEGVKISGYPTLLLYRVGEKEPLAYSGDRSAEDMLRWLSLRVKGVAFEPEELMKQQLQEGEAAGDVSVLEEL